MNKRDAVYLCPDDLVDTLLSLAATGLYVQLAAYCQRYETGGVLASAEGPLDISSMADTLSRTHADIVAPFHELLETGFIAADAHGRYILPIIQHRQQISFTRAAAAFRRWNPGAPKPCRQPQEKRGLEWQ